MRVTQFNVFNFRFPLRCVWIKRFWDERDTDERVSEEIATSRLALQRNKEERLIFGGSYHLFNSSYMIPF
jgi:hypothetical protein